MKKILLVILSGLMVLSLAACGGEKTNNNENNQNQTEAVQSGDFEKLKTEFQKKTAEDLVKECFADKANPTAQEFAKLYENYAFLDVNEEYDFDSQNVIADAVKLIKDGGAKTVNAANPEVISYLINSKYDGARAYAYRQQSSNNIDTSASIYAPLLEKALSETEPTVVYGLLRGLPQSYGNNEAFWNFAISHAKSEDANIRRAVAIAFDRFGLENKDAAVEAAIALMNDADKSVKQHALNYAGNIGDDRVVDTYRAVLMDEAQAKDYHGNALMGLVKLWYGYPTHKNTSEAGYKLTMEYLTTH